jgi:cell division protein FtsW
LAIALLTQPDTDTFVVTITAALLMYMVAGAKWKHFFIFIFLGAIALAGLIYAKPYLRQRVETMLNPKINNQTSSYQLSQSLIAVGSGGLSGRGFGQSIQKFHYLPEPIGDSVFAVAAEEFGFVGSLLILIVFILFGLEGLKISSNASDNFGRLLSLGIVILIVSQAFVNIAGMIGVLPLMGIPLPFVSHGGTALLITLVEAGIVMSISRGSKKIKS